MVDTISQVALFILEILPALIYSIFVEKRYTSRNAVVFYGIQMFVFIVTSLYFFPQIQYWIILSLLIIGIIWIALGAIQKETNILLSYKTLAAIQIPIVLHGYGVWIWTHLGFHIPLTMVILGSLFFWLSVSFRE